MQRTTAQTTAQQPEPHDLRTRRGMGEAAAADFLGAADTFGMTLRMRGRVVPAMVTASTQLSTWSHSA